MAHNLVLNNPLISLEEINPDVVVDYDHDKNRFYVTFVATNTGYPVERGQLVSENFKYEDTIICEILSPIDETLELVAERQFNTEPELDVLFSGKAYNEVHSIWMANCDLF
ncbi:MAG: hypothetical protein IJE68_05065 [Clostridia bacterium]|nr:hypothetical protein [Clostridia bacterium]